MGVCSTEACHSILFRVDPWHFRWEGKRVAELRASDDQVASRLSTVNATFSTTGCSSSYPTI